MSQETAAPAADATGSAQAEANGVKVDLIVFDMGKVFVDFNWDEVVKGFSTTSGKTTHEVRQVFAYLHSIGYECGRITTADFLRELNGKLGCNLTLDEFKGLWNVTFHEDQAMAAVLQALSSRLPLYLLSNTNEIHFAHLQDNFNVTRHFQEVLLSFQLGHSKPDTEVFQEVLNRSGLAAHRILFVDDLPPNIAAAQVLGMKVIRFTNVDDFKKQARTFGIEL